MAKATKKSATGPVWSPKPKRKRPGIHAKTKHDWSKQGRHWKKPSRGQGS